MKLLGARSALEWASLPAGKPRARMGKSPDGQAPHSNGQVSRWASPTLEWASLPAGKPHTRMGKSPSASKVPHRGM
ncbi:hypothetical protein XYCOK13_15490 [Xylanibacillus composti]|uniref:Uncharacterized protein n=1 Tax=Xylanibacillus composti TaxID=1572762 RepID=A0A8J4H317_9BACL|nr:hypothetical protein XYCOK13_15490 [Xylanibacillus composti]